jgi:hypothetical protein
MNPDSIDDLARALSPYRPAASRIEQVRTAVLAGAPAVARLRPRSRRPVYAVIGAVALAAAAAAAAVVWIARSPAAATAEDAAMEPARVDAPGMVVPIDDVRVDRDDEALVPVVETPATAVPPEHEMPSAIDPPRRAPKAHLSTGTPPSPAKAPLAAPGEAEFRAGWTALKADDPVSAAASFEAARHAKGSAVAEDASFWEGIALARAGQSRKAIAALRRFVVVYPSSSRAGEAAAKLGWLLYDAGELDAAQRQFESADDNVVPKVQKSARDGLEAVARKRGVP